MSAIRKYPTSVHQDIIMLIHREISDTLDPNRFCFTGNSFPDADLGLLLIYRTSMRNETPTFAVKVGFSEPSEGLREKGRLLLRTTSVKAVILIDIKESLPNGNPIGKYKSGVKQGQFKEDSIEIYKEAYDEQGPKAEIGTKGDHGELYNHPYMYNIPWVNELTAAVHILGRDSDTGEISEKMKKVVSTKHSIFRPMSFMLIVCPVLLWPARVA